MKARRVQRLAKFAALAISCAAPALVSAEGVGVLLEPIYSHSDARSTDPTGHTVTSVVDDFEQRYQLTFDRRFAPLLQLRALGLFDKTLDWSTTQGVSSRSDALRTSGSAHLTFGPAIFGGDLGYDRSEDSAGGSLSPQRSREVSENYTLRTWWHPVQLPSLDLRLSHAHLFDGARLTDIVTDDALLSSTYDAYRQLTLGYTLRVAETSDRLGGTQSTSVFNTATVRYTDDFNDRRTQVNTTYTIANRLTQTSASGGAGTVPIQQVPLAGLSLEETVTTRPEDVVLNRNPNLVDGCTTPTAPGSTRSCRDTTLNLGLNPALSGNTNALEMGVQFADPTTPVNTLFLYVDRSLTGGPASASDPVSIILASGISAWQSGDGQHWTPIVLPAPATWDELQMRFAVTLPTTRAPYLKLVVRRLPATASASRDRYGDIFVTELQAYQIVAASTVRGLTGATSQVLAGSVRQVLLRRPDLSYDGTLLLTRTGDTNAYTMIHGLGYASKLSRTVALSARVSRQDVGQPGQHSGTFQWSASANATPLPALTHGLTYGGQWTQTARGDSTANSMTLVNRAEFYKGVNALATAGYIFNTSETGQTSRGPIITASTSVAPHRTLTLSGTYYYTSLSLTGGNVPEASISTQRVDGAVSYNPVPALYLAGGVSRVINAGKAPSTLANFGANFSPFPYGDLLLRFSYSESLDTGNDAKSRVATAGAHWSVATGTFLDLGYTLIDASAPTGATSSRVFQANLVIQL